MRKSTLYAVASVLMAVAFVMGLIQGFSGGGWLLAAVPFALGATMVALWSRASRAERS